MQRYLTKTPVTKHSCVLLRDTQQFCCGFDRNYFRQQNLAKTVSISVIKSLDFNLLFIEILLFKISHITIVLILLFMETTWPSNVAYLKHIF